MEQAAKAVRFRFSAGGCSSILPPCYCTESDRHLSRVSVKIVAIALRGLGLFGMGCEGRVFVGYVLGISRRCAPQRGRTSPAAFGGTLPDSGEGIIWVCALDLRGGGGTLRIAAPYLCAPSPFPSPTGGGNFLGCAFSLRLCGGVIRVLLPAFPQGVVEQVRAAQGQEGQGYA